MDRCRRTSAAALPVYRWIGANLPRDATLLAYYDPVVYLRTGHRACRFFIASRVFYREDRTALEAACRSATSLARAQGLTYALLTPGDPEIQIAGESRLAGQWLLPANQEWQPVHREAGGTVYRIGSSPVAHRPDGGIGPDATAAPTARNTRRYPESRASAE
jgi:hypothetical protein